MAIVERFKQELMYELSAGTKRSGRYREVAVVKRWSLVEVRLYSISSVRLNGHRNYFATDARRFYSSERSVGVDGRSLI